jgi:ferritin-like metal-binding protein YciE
MADAGTLHDAFIDELRDAYDAEKQLTKALPKMAKAASSPELRTAFEEHLEETKGQIERLEQVFESLDEKVRGKHCEGIAGIIEEGKSVMEEDFDGATMDACLIAGGQRAEHYEMAAYGTLIAWAKALGHMDAVDLLQQTLDEEKAADETLSSSQRVASIRLLLRPLKRMRMTRRQSPSPQRADGRRKRNPPHADSAPASVVPQQRSAHRERTAPGCG